jgi:hypothetical protein
VKTPTSIEERVEDFQHLKPLEHLSRRLKPLIDTGLETGAKMLINGKFFQPFEYIEPFEPIKPQKPPKPLIPYICVTLQCFK